MIKAVIIDDERNSRDIIALMLGKYCPDITIAAMASDCADGIEQIRHHKPELVFLDLEMPDGTGFDVLNGAEGHPFEAVFVTAFEKKFLHTIRFSEVEIMLKPIDKESLLQAVAITSHRIQSGASKQRYAVLLENFRYSQPASWQMLLPASDEKDQVIPLADITYLEAQQDHSLFHLRNGAQLLSERSFRYYADLLTPLRFYQINNMQMVQIHQIQRVHQDSNQLTLSGGVKLDITERRKKDLMQQR